MKVYVVGSGGSGQSYFIGFLQKNGMSTNPVHEDGNTNSHKHLYNPNNLKKSYDKCIYLFNDPFKCFYSWHRRKWPLLQIKKLGNPYKLTESNVNKIEHFLSITEQMGKDVTGIEKHFDNWINYNNDKMPIYFLDFNSVLDNKELLNNFFGMELDYSLFEYKKRKSNYEITSSVVKDIYEILYEKMKAKSIEKNNLLT